MIIFLLIMLVLCGGAAGFGIYYAYNEKSPASSLSGPARALVKEYNALPKDSRPFPDILTLVKALDAKHEIDTDARRRHFDRNWLAAISVQNGPYSFTWNPKHGHCNHSSTCKFREYVDIHRAIQDVQLALVEKERKIATLSAAPATDMLKELETALRREAQLQRDITKDHL